jgi:hypothetical protein
VACINYARAFYDYTGWAKFFATFIKEEFMLLRLGISVAAMAALSLVLISCKSGAYNAIGSTQSAQEIISVAGTHKGTVAKALGTLASLSGSQCESQIVKANEKSVNVVLTIGNKTFEQKGLVERFDGNNLYDPQYSVDASNLANNGNIVVSIKPTGDGTRVVKPEVASVKFFKSGRSESGYDFFVDCNIQSHSIGAENTRGANKNVAGAHTGTAQGLGAFKSLTGMRCAAQITMTSPKTVNVVLTVSDKKFEQTGLVERFDGNNLYDPQYSVDASNLANNGNMVVSIKPTGDGTRVVNPEVASVKFFKSGRAESGFDFFVDCKIQN